MTVSTIRISSWNINGSVLTKRALPEKFTQHEISFNLFVFVLCSTVVFSFLFYLFLKWGYAKLGVGGT